jgi:hypothetical protein
LVEPLEGGRGREREKRVKSGNNRIVGILPELAEPLANENKTH